MWKAAVRAILMSISVVLGLVGCAADDQSGLEEAGDGGLDGSTPNGQETDASGQTEPARDGGDAAQRDAGATADGGSTSGTRPALGTLCTTTPSVTTCFTEDVLAKMGARIKAVRTELGPYAGFEVTVSIPNFAGTAVRITSLLLKGAVIKDRALPRAADEAEVLHLLLPEEKCEHESRSSCSSTDTVDGIYSQSVCEGQAVSTMDEPSLDIGAVIHTLNSSEVWATFSGTIAVEDCFPKKLYVPRDCHFDPNAEIVELVCDANDRCHPEARQPRHCIDAKVPFEATLRLPFPF